MNNEVVSWASVALAVIAGLPGIIGAAAAYVAAKRSGENKVALEEVHKSVDGNLSRIQAKLDEALRTIGELTGEPAKTTADAPTGKDPL